MPAPTLPPIGLQLTNTAKRVNSAFDAALAAAGGSLPTWLILLTIKTQSLANQQQIADAIGVRGPTLTYHLDAMESSGLLTRRRDERNRRSHVVELTDDGHRAFDAMRSAAVQFDRRLRAGLSDRDIERLRTILRRLYDNVDGEA